MESFHREIFLRGFASLACPIGKRRAKVAASFFQRRNSKHFETFQPGERIHPCLRCSRLLCAAFWHTTRHGGQSFITLFGGNVVRPISSGQTASFITFSRYVAGHSNAGWQLCLLLVPRVGMKFLCLSLCSLP